MNPKDYAAHWIANHVADARMSRRRARQLAAKGRRYDDMADSWRQQATELMARARALKNALEAK